QEPPSFFPPSFCISFSLILSLSLHFSLSISLCLSLSISLSLSLHFSLFGLQTDGGSCLPHSQKLPKIIHHKCVCVHVCSCVCVCVLVCAHLEGLEWTALRQGSRVSLLKT